MPGYATVPVLAPWRSRSARSYPIGSESSLPSALGQASLIGAARSPDPFGSGVAALAARHIDVGQGARDAAGQAGEGGSSQFLSGRIGGEIAARSLAHQPLHLRPQI